MFLGEAAQRLEYNVDCFGVQRMELLRGDFFSVKKLIISIVNRNGENCSVHHQDQLRCT